MSIILRMTWRELLRKRVLLLTLIMTAVFLVAFWFIADTLGRELRNMGLSPDDPRWIMERFSMGLLIVGLGFFFGSFVVAFLAIFSCSSVVAGEAEQGVLQALMPRPLPRWHWYAGRWLGYVSFGMLYAFILYTAILVIAGLHASVPRDAVSLVLAYLLFASVVPLLVSLSMLGSGFLSAIGNGVLMTMLYGGGWLGGMIEKVATQMSSLGAGKAHSLAAISGILMLVMPADGLQRTTLNRLFNLSVLHEFQPDISGLLSLLGVGLAPSPAFLVYALFYAAAALVIGAWRFQRKDL